MLILLGPITRGTKTGRRGVGTDKVSADQTVYSIFYVALHLVFNHAQ